MLIDGNLLSLQPPQGVGNRGVKPAHADQGGDVGVSFISKTLMVELSVVKVATAPPRWHSPVSQRQPQRHQPHAVGQERAGKEELQYLWLPRISWKSARSRSLVSSLLKSSELSS
jgi:hypothetical protein